MLPFLIDDSCLCSPIDASISAILWVCLHLDVESLRVVFAKLKNCIKSVHNPRLPQALTLVIWAEVTGHFAQLVITLMSTFLAGVQADPVAVSQPEEIFNASPLAQLI